MRHRLAAFLRGVNVGGNRKIDMANLREVLEGVGMRDVRTVLQSGNAVFVHGGPGTKVLAARIEAAIEARFGFAPSVLLRTFPELERAMSEDPLVDVAADPSRHLIGFLRDVPPQEAVVAAESESKDEDRVHVIGRHLYMWCPYGISRSPLFKVDFDRILGTPLTMRNWNTVTKVADLLRS